MILTCPACEAAFRVRQQDFGPFGRKVRCSACGHHWHALAEDLSSTASRAQSVPEEKGALPQLRARLENEDEAARLPSLRLAAVRQERLMPPAASPRKAGWKPGRGPARPYLVALVPALAVAGGLALAWSERERIVAAFPEAAGFYQLLGVEVNPARASLSLQDVTLLRARVESENLLIVEGWVANSGRGPVQLPPLEARLLDRDGRPLHRWSFVPEQEVLNAGERSSFRTQTADLDAAVSIDIDFQPGSAP